MEHNEQLVEAPKPGLNIRIDPFPPVETCNRLRDHLGEKTEVRCCLAGWEPKEGVGIFVYTDEPHLPVNEWEGWKVIWRSANELSKFTMPPTNE